jgi:hypothetical protein
MLPYLPASEVMQGDVDDLRMLLEEQYPFVSLRMFVMMCLGDADRLS